MDLLSFPNKSTEVLGTGSRLQKGRNGNFRVEDQLLSSLRRAEACVQWNNHLLRVSGGWLAGLRLWAPGWDGLLELNKSLAPHSESTQTGWLSG